MSSAFSMSSDQVTIMSEDPNESTSSRMDSPPPQSPLSAGQINVWARKALVEKRIRDVEHQVNEMCGLVFGDLLQLFSDDDQLKGK